MREISEVIRDRYPKGPTVELTELGRGFASQLEFPSELEEYLPTFFRDILPKLDAIKNFLEELAHKDLLIELDQRSEAAPGVFFESATKIEHWRRSTL